MSVLASVATSITAHLRDLPPGAVYAVVAALVFSESAIFVGFVLPGETSVIVAGAVASAGRVNIVVLCAIVMGAAIAGFSAGYAVGDRFGHVMMRWRVLDRRRAAIERSLRALEDRGAAFVFLGRFTAFLRAIMPALAGMSEMRHRRFQVANVASAVPWSIAYCLAGYYAGKSITRVETDSAWFGAVILGAVILAAIVLHLVRRRRRRA